jgi:hypothetical protein
LKILIRDDDVDVPGATYTFKITEANETPKGIIDFEDADDLSSKERWLRIVAPMDRESEEIIDLNGILTYVLTVTDSGNNENSMEVSQFNLI